MEVLARFAILPGAAELMEAFAVIPVGPMRDAVIHLALTTAATYSATPQAAAPQQAIPRINQPAQLQAPQTRTGRAPPTESLEMEIVKMRIEGVEPRQIAFDLRLDPHTVYHALAAARKAGAPIPKRVKLMPKGGQDARAWPVTVDDISTTQGHTMAERAAEKRGISKQAYLDRRNLAMRLAMEGATWESILEQTGETDRKVVSAWMSAARSAGHRVPYITAEDSYLRRQQAGGRLEAVG